MNTTMHPIAPEEIMAHFDGQLSPHESAAIAQHIDQCAECADLAAGFRSLSQTLSSWEVPTAPVALESPIMHRAEISAEKLAATAPSRSGHGRFGKPHWLALLGAGGFAVVITFLAASRLQMHLKADSDPMDRMDRNSGAAPRRSYADPDTTNQYAAPPPTATRAQERSVPGALARSALASTAMMAPAPGFERNTGPMIARTVTLSLVVRDYAAARAALETVLTRYHGYAANLTASTPEGASRSLRDSLRIPTDQLAPALSEIKALGRVENETQSGEEVTQQHSDFSARLKNSRDTEDRLRAILQQRTGKIEEVLTVEQEIASVRGDIESMEAQQKALEHRVDFATIDLQLTEEYKAQPELPAPSFGNRLHKALVVGFRNFAAVIGGIVLFIAEYGPTLLFLAALLGLPVWLIRRFRKRH